MRRGIISIAIVLLVINLDFILPHLVTGNAAEINTAGGYGQITQQAILESRYQLNQPLLVQYLHYMQGIFSWPPNLGTSFLYYPQSVTSLIATRIGWTMGLIFVSLGLALLLIFTMAMVSATRRGGKFEVISLYMSLSFHSIPVYWFAIVLLWVFGVVLGWFPVFGSVNPSMTFGSSHYIYSVIIHGVLPVTALTVSLMGEYYLVLRSSIQEVLQSDYVLAAQSRGLKQRLIALRYIMRNSLLPIVSLLTFSLAGLVGRVVYVEAVFGYPGLGDLTVDGILTYDYPVIEGTFFVLVLIVVLGGFIGDVLLMRLDPKLRVKAAL